MARGPPALPDSYNPRVIITAIIARLLIIPSITIITISTITITILIVMFWTQRFSPVSVAPVLNHSIGKRGKKFFCCNNKEPKLSGLLHSVR